jgi:hypothetical protein
MVDDPLLEPLVGLLGLIFPAVGTDPAQMDDLRDTAVRALRRGQKPEDATSSFSPLRPWPRPEDMAGDAELETLRRLLAAADDIDLPTPHLLRRTHPLPGALALDGRPAWSHGRRPDRTLGPFVEAHLRPVWFDIWESAVNRLITRASIVAGRPDEPLVAFAPAPGGGPQAFDIPPGPVWLRAALFDPTAPRNGWIGLDVTGGRLEADSPFGPGPGPATLRAPSAAKIRLRLRLAAPAAAVAGADAAGAAALACAVDPPDEVTVSLEPQGGTLEIRGGVALSLGGPALALAAVPAAALRYDETASALCLPLAAAAPRIQTALPPGRLWRTTGEAVLQGAELAFSLATLPAGMRPESLGAVDGTPILRLELGPGLTLAVAALRDAAGAELPVPLEAAVLLARTGAVSIAGRPPGRLVAEERLTPAWAVPAEAASEVALGAAGLGLLQVAAEARPDRPAADTVRRNGAPFRALLGRPWSALGPVRLAGQADVLEVASAEAAGLVLRAAPIEFAFAEKPRAFLVGGGLLRTRRATGFVFEARRGAAEDRLDAGWITLGLELDLVLPTLADPYASDRPGWDAPPPARGPEPGQALVATAEWAAEGAEPAVTFGLRRHDVELLGASAAKRAAPAAAEERRALDEAFRGRNRAEVERCRLLDLSGRADFLGLALYGPVRSPRLVASIPEPLVLQGMRLGHDLSWTDLFLLPGFLNETIGNTAQPSGAPPFPDVLRPLGDGGPQRLLTSADGAVPLDPAVVADAMVSAFGRHPLRGLLSLPFGMRAVAVLDGDDPTGGTAKVVRPLAADGQLKLEGAWQLRLEAKRPPGAGQPGAPSAALPGMAHQLPLGRGVGGTPVSALGQPFHDFFNSAFSSLAGAANPLVPVERLDVSGHGNSLVSVWADPARRPGQPGSAGVSETRFEALVGRVALEVVQVVTTCHPWRIPMVREVTLRRTRGGAVWRSDSGWQPAGPGRADYENLPEASELAAFRGVGGVVNVRELQELLQGPQGLRLQAVRFDGMAEVEGLDAPTPIRDMAGWVELDPRPPGVSDADILRFVLTPAPGTGRGGCYGRLDTTVDLAGSGLGLRAAALGIALASPAPGLAGVLRGSPVLPARGSWTMLRRDVAGAGHRSLAPGEDVPVTGLGGTRLLREPADLKTAQDPAIEYALLHASDAHRFLLPDPRIQPGGRRIEAGRTPLLVDWLAMAGHAAVMPPEAVCIPLAGAALEIPAVGHLALVLPGGAVEVPAPPGRTWRELALDGKVADSAMRLEYRGLDGRRSRATLTIDTRDPLRHWTLELGQLCVTTDYESFGRFSTAAAVLRAGADRAPDLEEVTVEFSGALGAAQSFMDIMRRLTFPRVGSTSQALTGDDATAERAKRPFNPVYFGNEFKLPLGTKAKVAVPGAEDRVDLDPVAGWADFGGGKIKATIGVFLRIDHVEEDVHRERNLFHGFKFEISGKLLFPFIKPLYCGGALKVKYEYHTGADPDPTQYYEPRKEKHKFELQGGVVGYIGANFKAFEAEVSVTMLHILKLQGSFSYGVKYQFEGQASLLSIPEAGLPKGLVGIAVGFECMCTPSRAKDANGEDTEEVTFFLQAAVVLEITLCWVFTAEVTAEIEKKITVGLPTFAAFARGNPLLLAGELA